MLNHKSILALPWWLWIIVIDIALLLVTSFQFQPELLYQGWRLLSAFDLGNEMNLAVWWSAMQQVALALVCFEIYRSTDKTTSRPWLLLSILFYVLAVDEIASVHERIPHLAVYLFYMPLIFILANYALYLLFREKKTKKTAFLILCGFCFYGSVFIQELLEHRVDFPFWFKGIRLAIEEGSELCGTLLILFGVMPKRPTIGGASFSKIIPIPQLGQAFNTLLWGGFLVHVLICFFIVPALDDLDRRGNPGVFYPVLINFILFCFFFWKSKELENQNRSICQFICVIFLVSSMGSIYSLLPLVPKISLIIAPELITGNFQLLYGIQIISILVFLTIIGAQITLKIGALLSFMLGIMLLSFFAESITQSYLLLGCFVFLTGQFFAQGRQSIFQEPRSDYLSI